MSGKYAVQLSLTHVSRAPGRCNRNRSDPQAVHFLLRFFHVRREMEKEQHSYRLSNIDATITETVQAFINSRLPQTGQYFFFFLFFFEKKNKTNFPSWCASSLLLEPRRLSKNIQVTSESPFQLDGS